MSADDRFDRQLAAWMTERATKASSQDRLAAITDLTGQRRPRPAWLAGVGSDWFGPATTRPAGATTALRRAVVLALLAALLVATVIGVAGLVGGPPLRTSSPPLPMPGLAYVLDGDIFVADADGTRPVRALDSDPAAPCGGFWGLAAAPDGRHVALRSSGAEGCPQVITIVDQDGHIISSFRGEGWDISWSPDSTRVVTWLAMDGDGSVGVYGVDGALQTVLDGSNSCCGDFDPVWSPDGAPSILIRHRDADGQPIVFELPLDRTTPRPVPRDDPRSMLYSADSKQPVVYSPDGSRAAFFESSLAVVDADGTGRRDLVAGADGEVVGWSPNGGEIAFVDAPAARLSVVDVASGSVTTIATGSGISAEGFSPDGDRVLYTTPRGLWAANADGSGARVLVEGADSGAWLAPRSDAAPSHAP